jgi:hypothetical protein
VTRVSFDSTKKPLEELLRQAHAGQLQLPDFQRSWVWKDDGLRALLASVSRSFPVGTLMTLQTGGEVFKPRLIEGAPATNGSAKPDALVLDGQQRITSLYQLTMRQDVVATRDVKKQPIRRWYYIDMKAALDPEVDREAAIVGVREDRTELRGFEVVRDLSTPECEFEQCMFPTNKIFDFRSWEEGFEDYWESKDGGREMRKFFRRFHDEVLAAFKQYQMPVIELDKGTSREAVCLVFEKVNTGGEKLDAFELLTAIYAASSFDLRADWRGGGEAGEGRAKRMASGIAFPKNSLTQLQPTDFLQAVSLLHSLERRRALAGSGEPPPVTAKRDDLLRIPLDRYKALAPRVEAGFVAAGKLLFGQRVYGVKDLPYQSQLLPLAAILADLGPKADTQDARAKLVRWWWSGVFGELYGSAIETRFARDVQEVPAWIAGGEEPATVRDATFRSERLDTRTSRLSAAYKGVHVLLMQTGAQDFRSGQPFDHLAYFGESVDIHHIFPRAWCEANKIKRDQYDTIVNKTPLFYKSNRIIGGSAPSAYLARLLKEKAVESEDRQDEILRTHGIAPAYLRADNFLAFYEARREALLRLIETAMGKAAYRGEVALAEAAEPPDQDEEQEDEIVEAVEELAA